MLQIVVRNPQASPHPLIRTKKVFDIEDEARYQIVQHDDDELNGENVFYLDVYRGRVA